LKKRPSCVKAEIDLANFISSLKKGCYLEKIITNGIDTLRENMFAGTKIERKKFPKYYVKKYGIRNLYKINLDSKTRATYTLVADGAGVAVIILEVLDHKNYQKRFGYK
jgi:hypothetical protein